MIIYDCNMTLMQERVFSWHRSFIKTWLHVNLQINGP